MSTAHSMVDTGTPELRYKRLCLMGEEAGLDDMSLSESLLGLLYAHHLLEGPLYEAGCRLRELRYRYQPCLERYFYRSHALGPVLDKRRSSENFFTEKQESYRTKAWQNTIRILKNEGPRSYKMVMAVVFYDATLAEGFPAYFLKDLPFVRRGLASLDAYFTQGLQGKPGRPHDLAEDLDQATSFPPVAGSGPLADPQEPLGQANLPL